MNFGPYKYLGGDKICKKQIDGDFINYLLEIK